MLVLVAAEEVEVLVVLVLVEEVLVPVLVEVLVEDAVVLAWRHWLYQGLE